jgi:hypothetical protein
VRLATFGAYFATETRLNGRLCEWFNSTSPTISFEALVVGMIDHVRMIAVGVALEQPPENGRLQALIGK